MTFRPTPEAIERAKRTIEVAGVFIDNAPVIARACAEAAPSEIVVAVTDPEALFHGVFLRRVQDLLES